MNKVLLTSGIILSSFLGFATATPVMADTMQNAKHMMSDTAITTAVKAKLAANSVTKAMSISVKTEKGMVWLSGAVSSDTEATTAVELANSVDGVKDVNEDNLKVNGSDDMTQAMKDAYITAKVKGLFMREKMMNTDMPAMGVKVETTNGVVYLSGDVDSKTQVHKAMKLAKSIKGVMDVKSTLKVKA